MELIALGGDAHQGLIRQPEGQAVARPLQALASWLPVALFPPATARSRRRLRARNCSAMQIRLLEQQSEVL